MLTKGEERKYCCVTVHELKSQVQQVVHDGAGNLVTTLKVFAGLGFSGVVLWILYVVITQTTPEQNRASEQRMHIAIDGLRQSHEKVADRTALAFEKSVDKLAAEMQKDRDSIGAKLDEGNRTQRRLLERLIGLQTEELEATQPSAPPPH